MLQMALRHGGMPRWQKTETSGLSASAFRKQAVAAVGSSSPGSARGPPHGTVPPVLSYTFLEISSVVQLTLRFHGDPPSLVKMPEKYYHPIHGSCWYLRPSLLNIPFGG